MTGRALSEVGGAEQGKAIIILNPVELPMIMRDTVFCMIGADADRDAIRASVAEMVDDVQRYVPGYTLRAEPQFDDPAGELGRQRPGHHAARGAGQRGYLPEYAGNLDIMTAAAARVGELMAEAKLGVPV